MEQRIRIKSRIHCKSPIYTLRCLTSMFLAMVASSNYLQTNAFSFPRVFARRTPSFRNRMQNPPVILAMVRHYLPPSTPACAINVQNSDFNCVVTATGTAMAMRSLSLARNPYFGFQKRVLHRENGQDNIMLMMTQDDYAYDGVPLAEKETSLQREWNVPELKTEIARLISRCYKKIGKAATRLEKGNQKVEELRTDPDATLEDLESCPNTKIIEFELENLKTRMKNLSILNDKLQELKLGKKKEVMLPEDVVLLIMELDVKDEPPKREPKAKKKKGSSKKTALRKPYFQYYTENNTEIRVGRRSSDNDELSCNPQHRDGPDWWMHASGCPGSHVVVRCHDDNLDQEVINDAASLAARQSKCTGNIIKVSLTRCRDVKKPPGAAAGLVQLTGKVRNVSVDMKKAEKRLSRLDETCEKIEG